VVGNASSVYDRSRDRRSSHRIFAIRPEAVLVCEIAERGTVYHGLDSAIDEDGEVVPNQAFVKEWYTGVRLSSIGGFHAKRVVAIVLKRGGKVGLDTSISKILVESLCDVE